MVRPPLLLSPFSLTSRWTALTFRVTIYPVDDAGQQEYMYEPLLNERPSPSEEFVASLDWLATIFSFPSFQAHLVGKELLKLRPSVEEGEEVVEEVVEEGVSEVIDVDET